MCIKTAYSESMTVEVEQLANLQEALKHREAVEYQDPIRQLPRAVKREHINDRKELKFTRADFVRDILFTEQGFGLEPRLLTKSTEKLPDDEKIASTSAKDHLPYF